MEDEWLIRRCLEGKTAYWNVLVVRYRQRLFERVSRRIASREDAWEVVDAAFYHLRESVATRVLAGNLRSRNGSFFTLLLRSAAESFIRKVRGDEA